MPPSRSVSAQPVRRHEAPEAVAELLGVEEQRDREEHGEEEREEAVGDGPRQILERCGVGREPVRQVLDPLLDLLGHVVLPQRPADEREPPRSFTTFGAWRSRFANWSAARGAISTAKIERSTRNPPSTVTTAPRRPKCRRRCASFTTGSSASAISTASTSPVSVRGTLPTSHTSAPRDRDDDRDRHRRAGIEIDRVRLGGPRVGDGHAPSLRRHGRARRDATRPHLPAQRRCDRRCARADGVRAPHVAVVGTSHRVDPLRGDARDRARSGGARGAAADAACVAVLLVLLVVGGATGVAVYGLVDDVTTQTNRLQRDLPDGPTTSRSGAGSASRSRSSSSRSEHASS